MRHAADFRLAVQHRVKALPLAVIQRADAARLAEIDVAGQLAQDHDIQAGNQLRLQAGCIGQLGIYQRRAQVGEQPQTLADAQQPLFGRSGRGNVSYW